MRGMCEKTSRRRRRGTSHTAAAAEAARGVCLCVAESSLTTVDQHHVRGVTGRIFEYISGVCSSEENKGANMADDEALRALMLALSYVLMKRRRDVTSANAQRRHEVQRRVARRQYFHQRHKRMIMVGYYHY